MLIIPHWPSVIPQQFERFQNKGRDKSLSFHGNDLEIRRLGILAASHPAGPAGPSTKVQPRQ